MTYLRIVVTIAVAAAINWGLLGLMQYMIATGEEALSEDRPVRLTPFVHVKPDETVEPKRQPTEKPTPPLEPPRTTPPRTRNEGVIKVTSTGKLPPVDPGTNITPKRFGIVDGDYLPIVKVAPIYPRRAQERGLEGSVLLEFTVTRLGTVSDIVVLEADPPGIFNAAAVNAAAKFKYRPKVVNGDAIDTVGVQHLISFRLDDD